jgi:hypothetical protein
MDTLAKTDKSAGNIVFLFIGIWLCALIGFHRTYTVHFPQFKGFQWQHHFHGIMLMSWFGMLIIQPLLIRLGKNNIHRQLGKLGYVLAPLVCYSIFLVTKLVYHREILVRPEPSVLAQMALDIPEIFIFGIFFTLAMVNRHNPNTHMRYMIGTSLLMIGPGLGRALIVFGGMAFPAAVTVVYYVAEVIAVLFLLNDFRKRNNPRPMLTIVAILLFNHFLWAFQEAAFWQKFAKWFVDIAF